MLRAFLSCAAFIAALSFGGVAVAQDVTLTARGGGLSISGTLKAWDGEFYRIESKYGPLTLDGQGVVCDGPGCPDLTAPRIPVRLVGDAAIGAALFEPLVLSFAATHGYDYARNGSVIELSQRDGGQVLAEFSFIPMSHDKARAALLGTQAELILSAAADPDLGSVPMALDALVPIVAANNPVALISSTDLAKALSGQVENWSEIGGPDMPIALHALAPENGVQRALVARLGQDMPTATVHDSLQDLAQAVAGDPWALAVTGRAAAAPARVITLTDSCGFPLRSDPMAVKSEDYPLSLPLYLLTPRRRLPLMARDFIDFLSLPQAQAAIAASGYVDRKPTRQALTGDGLRLINAIQGAGDETTLDDLKSLVDAMAGADRVSLTFRFEDGSTTLDAHSQANLDDLARMLESGQYDSQRLLLVGFSDGSGDAETNLDLSRERAQSVLDALAVAAPDLHTDRLPDIAAFGEALPMACDETNAGRRLNRRVELWLQPAFKGSRPNGN